MPNWRSPTIGPFLHGLAIFLITEGYPITEYVYNAVVARKPGTEFNWEAFFLGFAATALAVIISAGRNAGAVQLTKDEALWVKGAQQEGGEAVIATAREVVPNDQAVIILRDRPPVTTDPRNVPAELPPRP